MKLRRIRELCYALLADDMAIQQNSNLVENAMGGQGVEVDERFLFHNLEQNAGQQKNSNQNVNEGLAKMVEKMYRKYANSIQVNLSYYKTK